MIPRSFLAALLLVLAAGLWLGQIDIVEAHGGGFPRLTNVAAGPYRVSVWTQPQPLTVGLAHFSVSVTTPLADGFKIARPEMDAEVELTLVSGDDKRSSITLPATHVGLLNRFNYEAEVELPFAGRWDVIVKVSGDAGVGSTGFSVDVQPPRPDTDWMVWSSLGLIGLILLCGAYSHPRGGGLPRIVLVLAAVVLAVTIGAVFWVRATALSAQAKTQSWGWFDTSQPDLVIEVTASQWQWSFTYPNTDISTPDLVLPVGKKAELILTSKDIVHAFSVPDFQLKRDAIPGTTTTVQVTPVQIGTYSIICEAFCGFGGENMLAEIRVVAPADFETWLTQQQQSKR